MTAITLLASVEVLTPATFIKVKTKTATTPNILGSKFKTSEMYAPKAKARVADSSILLEIKNQPVMKPTLGESKRLAYS